MFWIVVSVMTLALLAGMVVDSVLEYRKKRFEDERDWRREFKDGNDL
jgi:hypothetical protein